MTSSQPFVPALLVIDMQEDFCEPNGALAIKGGRDIAPLINHLLDWSGFVVKIGSKDVHPRDHISFASNHDNKEPFVGEHTILNPENSEETQTIVLWPDHVVEGTQGAELIPELHKHKLTHLVYKGWDKRVESYSAFGPPFRNPKVSMSDLDSTLKAAGVTDVFVVGLAQDFCVKYTAIDAVEHGFKTHVLMSATNAVARSEEARKATIADFEKAGVVVMENLEAPELQRVLQM